MKIALAYCLFAVFATLCNIATQELSITLYTGPYALSLSIGAGTLVGLVVKYLLDKRYIFCYTTTSTKHNRSVFLLYTFTGIFTTFIFWGLEFAFDAIWRSKELRYLGGVMGLSIGYIIKYQLDKRFVFRESLCT